MKDISKPQATLSFISPNFRAIKLQIWGNMMVVSRPQSQNTTSYLYELDVSTKMYLQMTLYVSTNDCVYRYGEDGLKGGGFGGGMGGFGGEGGFQNPFDIFEQFFGGAGAGGFGDSGGASRSRPQQGSDERADMTLDFNEAVFGVRWDCSTDRNNL